MVHETDELDTSWIDDSASLAVACDRWSAQEALALDTEFVRERTYFPILGLIQVASRDEIALVDPRAELDLDPLRALLGNPRIVKVLHSADQDIEVFDSALGVRIQGIFDSQIAAELAGVGSSLGYAALVERLFEVRLEKGETRTDWTRRPLSPAQVHYAVQDVRWLLAARDRLAPRLEELGRLDWHGEEAERLIADRLSPVRSRPPRGLSPLELAIFEAVHAWRETTARERDLPRGFVLQDGALAPLARKRPTTLEELAEVDGLRPRELKRYGREVLRVVGEALAIPRSQLPLAPSAERLSSRRHRELTKQLQGVVSAAAEALELEPSTLASRRLLTETIDRWLQGEDPVLPEALQGWRRPLLGDGILAVLEESLGPARRQ